MLLLDLCYTFRMVKKILIAIGAIVAFLFAAAFISIVQARNAPAPLVVANVTELDKIEKISRYRSCAGHVTVPQDRRENKRNMKHYFWVKPEYNKSNEVEIYAPYDGYVSILRSEPELRLEGEIWIAPAKMFALMPPFGMWNFSVQHIDVRDDLRVGDKVRAGELIGHAALSEERGDSFDIVYAKLGIPTKRIDNWTAPFADLDSLFNHMSDQVFAEYRNKGIADAGDIIMSKEARDQNPCEYQGAGPYFSNQFDEDNWAVLSD